MHESTKERLPVYSEIYQRIFHITGNPKSILDLGCGLNPLSYKYMKIKPAYCAIDISSNITNVVNDFFSKNKIRGKALIMNLREIRTKKLPLPKADVCFMFKLLDSIEIEKGHKLAEQLIKSVSCKWLAISFSTKTLSGKKMRHPYRGWIEQLCRRLGYFYEILETENEVFYLVRKN
jgi:16S rRNA (guanine(1405)-N(7))-methyltransferase